MLAAVRFLSIGALVVAGVARDLADDLNTILERRRPFVIQSALNVDSAPSWLETFQPNGTWPDVIYTSGCDAQRSNWPAQLHWQRIVALASIYEGGYSTGNLSALVGNPQVLETINTAVDWWFANDFTNPDCLTNGGATRANCPCGTPGLWNTNWFSNVILIPRLAGQTCILLYDLLSASQLETCARITARSFSTFGTGAGFLAGANILDIASIGVSSGVLSNNETLVADAFSKINAEVIVHPEIKVDGIKPDGSFSQHSGIIYNGNYGKDYTNAVLQLAIESAGTQFEPSNESRTAFVTLLNGTRWMIYENVKTGVLHYDFSVLGRFIAFSTADLDRTVAVSSILVNVTQVEQLGALWSDPTLDAVANQLQAPTKNANVGGLRGNRMFWSNDYMVHRGKKYFTTLKMYSSRTGNSECVNLANPLGFHLSDGTTYNHLDGTEYEDIAAAWDWNLIPGTTTDYGRTPLNCGTIQQSAPDSFVGGVSDGSRGLAAMKYTNPITGALKWQKAWFFVDGDAQHVMLNSIESTSPGFEVYSVLDQRRINGPIWVDSVKVLPDAGDDDKRVQNFTFPESLVHGGVGYVFEDTAAAATLSVSAGPRSGNWTDLGTSTQPPTTVPLFAAWIRHPDDQLSAPLGYTAFPGVWDPKQLCDAVAKVDLVTLANEPSRMGLFDAKKDIVYGAIWAAGAKPLRIPIPGIPLPLGPKLYIATDQPVLYIADLHDRNPLKWTITVAEPTQALESVNITLSLGGIQPPPSWLRADILGRTITVKLPTGGEAGSSVTVKLIQL